MRLVHAETRSLELSTIFGLGSSQVPKTEELHLALQAFCKSPENNTMMYLDCTMGSSSSPYETSKQLSSPCVCMTRRPSCPLNSVSTKSSSDEGTNPFTLINLMVKAIALVPYFPYPIQTFHLSCVVTQLARRTQSIHGGSSAYRVTLESEPSGKVL